MLIIVKVIGKKKKQIIDYQKALEESYKEGFKDGFERATMEKPLTEQRIDRIIAEKDFIINGKNTKFTSTIYKGNK